MSVKLIIAAVLIFSFSVSFSQKTGRDNYKVLSFGEGGQVKMIYDRRQRPQAVFIQNTVYLVYNGGAAPGENKTYPFVVSFHPETSRFTSPVQLVFK